MAIGYSRSSIIGGPLDDRVLGQLRAREEVYKSAPNRGYRTNDELLYLNSKTGWVKLSSSVNILDPDNENDEKGTSTLASSNILFGGTYNQNTTKTRSGIHGIGDNVKKIDAAYQLNKTTGFRPMPGITEFNIKAKNRFGTLREAEVGFQVWSVEQLTEFESLYLRPGFTVLLEFGHSMYIKNKKGKDKPPQVVLNPPKTLSDYFTGSQDKNKIQDKIKELKAKSNNNYDGVFGYIKNFSWSYRSDGGYDCRLTIISAGELIESVKIAMSPSEAGIAVPEPTGENYTIKSPMHIFLETINKIPIGRSSDRYDVIINDEVNKALELTCPGLLAAYKKFTGDTEFKILGYDLKSGFLEMDDGSNPPPDAFRYIKMRDLLALLNAAYLLEDDKKDKDGKPLKLFEFNLEFNKSLFYTFPDHIAIDPGIAVLPKNTTQNFAVLKYDISEKLPVTVACTNDGSTEIADESILNIFLSTDFILSKLDGINSKSEKDRTILAFIESILDTLTITMGDINDFGLHYEEDEYSFYLVDRKLTPNASDLINSRINLTGLRATVSNVSLSSRLSPNIAKMIAVSAQAAGTDVGEDTEHMFRWNKGLRDRIVGSRKFPELGTKDKKKKIFDQAAEIGRIVSEFNFSRSYEPSNYSNLVNVHKELMLYLSIRYNKKSVRNGAPGIIPFDLNITLDGLGGVKIGQAFTLNKGILPRKYDNMVAFLVTGVSHTIKNNKWNTDLKAQTIIIGKGDPLPEEESYEKLTEQELKTALAYEKAPPDPTKEVEILNFVTDGDTQLIPEIPQGGRLTREIVMKRLLNQNPIVQRRFGILFDILLDRQNFGGYKIKITSAYRSIERAEELFKIGKGAEPGKSSHIYACGLDFNVEDTNGITYMRADRPELWEITEVPKAAEQAGLKWGGGFKTGNGQFDPVHFAVKDFDYKKTYAEIIDVNEGATNSIILKKIVKNPIYFSNSIEKQIIGQRFVPRGGSVLTGRGSDDARLQILDKAKLQSAAGQRVNTTVGDRIVLARERSVGGFQ